MRYDNQAWRIQHFARIVFLGLIVAVSGSEGGFDDGPFHPEPAEAPEGVACGAALPVAGDELCSHDLETLAAHDITANGPRLSRRANDGKILWAVELNTNDMENTQFNRLYDLKLHEGLLSDRVVFAGCSIFGCERGRLYLDSSGEPDRS